MADYPMNEAYRGRSECEDCVHLYFNNGDADFANGGCRAFPNGIPSGVRGQHHEIIEGQTGNYFYQKAKYEELCPFAKVLYDLRIYNKEQRIIREHREQYLRNKYPLWYRMKDNLGILSDKLGEYFIKGFVEIIVWINKIRGKEI